MAEEELGCSRWSFTRTPNPLIVSTVVEHSPQRHAAGTRLGLALPALKVARGGDANPWRGWRGAPNGARRCLAGARSLALAALSRTDTADPSPLPHTHPLRNM